MNNKQTDILTTEGKTICPPPHCGLGGRVWRRCHVSLYIGHLGIQLILAYSLARPATTFIPVPLSSLSLSFISSTICICSLFSLSLGDDTK